MTQIKSAVTSVATNGAATSTPAPKGRPSTVLKGGILYKDAKANAKAAIRVAKSDVAAGKATLKTLERAAAVAAKGLTGANKALVTAEAKPLPDKAAQKSAVQAAKAVIKSAIGAVKDAGKAVDAQVKANGKLAVIHDKATAALLAVEASKLKTLN